MTLPGRLTRERIAWLREWLWHGEMPAPLGIVDDFNALIDAAGRIPAFSAIEAIATRIRNQQ